MRRQLFIFLLFITNNVLANPPKVHELPGQPVYRDTAFIQDYSVKYVIDKLKNHNNILLKKVCSDRNGVVEIYSSEGLLTLSGGKFLYPGELVHDVSYLAMANKKIKDICIYQNQFVYVDDKAVLSNAWAGKLYSLHSMQNVSMFSTGRDFSFLLSDGKALQYLQDSKILFEGNADDKLIDIAFDKKRNQFWLLGEHSISVFNPKEKLISVKYKGDDFTCFSLANENKELIIGTHNGYLKLNAADCQPIGVINKKLPYIDITVVKEIENKLWFGSVSGAFMLQGNSKYKYYASKRWIPSDKIEDIAEGSNHSVLILTDKGLGEIHFEPMTLHDKVMYFEKQVRLRHIRLGFNATISRMKDGDVSTGSLEDSDNDGLWTSMYLGAEVFRYAATKSKEALENCRESLDAMERLYIVTSLKGFPARSFERKGYEISDVATSPNGDKTPSGGNAGVQPPFEIWRHAENSEWDWKSTTSSDEAIGHMFVYGAIAELIDIPEIKNKAIRLMDALMEHIVDHKMYLVDWNGEPTAWGRWNPEYVNARPKNVGDRKITSSNIISMLQTAYHFTRKSIYKEKALELLNKYGYLENLMRPMKEIGYAPADADALSKDLSDGWNHSDDEMYFLGYWGLYRYALNDKLKNKFRKAILDHWEIERPEKEGAWDILTAITEVKQFDLNEAVWYLQKFPMDLVDWKIKNSERKDIEFIPANFRKQTIKEVLPPDELPINRHNSNRFDLDGGDENGSSELSAGDIWLLPYWMGRYLKVISAPVENKTEKNSSNNINTIAKEISHQDIPSAQRYSVKYYLQDNTVNLSKVDSGPNANIQVLSAKRLLKPGAGELLNPGSLVKELSYSPLTGKKISSFNLYKNKFVYADDKAIFSNALTGKIYTAHDIAGSSHLTGGRDFDFIVSNDTQLNYIKEAKLIWPTDLQSTVMNIQFQESKNLFWILSSKGLYLFSRIENELTNLFEGINFTCFKVPNNKIIIRKHYGYFQLNPPTFDQSDLLNQKLPSTDITTVEEVDGNLWFGSAKGAFMLHIDNQFDCYASEKCLPSDEVEDIAKGENGSVLILAKNGLGEICMGETILEQKAAHYESITRERSIRYGFYWDYTDINKTTRLHLS